MEQQFRSTLNIIKNSIGNTPILTKALKSIVESSVKNLKEGSIKDIPILDTLITCFNNSLGDITVRSLCCSAISNFSDYEFCVEQAKEIGLIELMADSLSREDNPVIVMSELVVISKYGVSESLISVVQSARIMEIIFRLETKWEDNYDIIVPILAICTIIASNPNLHKHIINSHFFFNLPAFFTKYMNHHFIVRGIVSVCYHLSASDDGRFYLRSVHFFQLIDKCFPEFGFDSFLCQDILHIVMSLNVDQRYRNEVLTNNGVTVCIHILNLRQQDQDTTALALQVIRSICSSEYKSLNAVLDNNTIAAVIMAVSAYPENVTICCHGIRAIEWILEAGGTQVVRMILDEDVLKLCTDLVAIHNDSELLRFICGVAGKICRYSGFQEHALNALVESQFVEKAVETMKKYKTNEAVMWAFSQFFVVLFSDREGAKVGIQFNALEVIVACANNTVIPETAMLQTGILWKAALNAEGKEQLIRMNAVDALLKLMQQFDRNVTVHRNAIGCLVLLTKDHLEVVDAFRRRLGLSLLLDTVETFWSQPQYCVQMIALMQNLVSEKDFCYEVMLVRNMSSVVLKMVRKQYRNITVCSMGLLFLDSLLDDEEIVYQLASLDHIIDILNQVKKEHQKVDASVAMLVDDITTKIFNLNNKLK